MLRIDVVNDRTGTEEFGNYDVTVVVNHQTIWRGKVMRHKRRQSWWMLLFRVLAAHQTRHG